MSRNEEFHGVHLKAVQYPADQVDVNDYESPHLTLPAMWREIQAYVPGSHPHDHIDGGTHIAHMTLYPTGHIARLEVADKYQRQGIATRMWHAARSRGWEPKDEAPDRLTQDGAAWATGRRPS